MNTRKSIAVIAAMAITVAGMVSIATYSNAAADAARNASNAKVEAIQIMPTMTVRPTRAQMLELQGEKAGMSATSATAMPYYSFAGDSVGA